MKENAEEIIYADQVDCQREAVGFYAGGKCCLRLLYREAVLICIECGGGKKIFWPLIEDIEEETKGLLVMMNIRGQMVKIDVSRTGKTAGEILIELSGHCPQAWLGGHELFENKNKGVWQSLLSYHLLNRR